MWGSWLIAEGTFEHNSHDLRDAVFLWQWSHPTQSCSYAISHVTAISLTATFCLILSIRLTPTCLEYTCMTKWCICQPYIGRFTSDLQTLRAKGALSVRAVVDLDCRVSTLDSKLWTCELKSWQTILVCMVAWQKLDDCQHFIQKAVWSKQQHQTFPPTQGHTHICSTLCGYIKGADRAISTVKASAMLYFPKWKI